MEYRTLENIDPDVLFGVYRACFGDETDTLRAFKAVLRRCHYTPDLSIGAFDTNSPTNSPVGMSIVGSGLWNGRASIFSITNCVLPAYRRQGIASTLLDRVAANAKEFAVTDWILECEVGNEAAKKLYASKGFAEKRVFVSWKAPRKAVLELSKAASDKYLEAGDKKIIPTTIQDVSRYAGFQDTQPSWQNSDFSIEAAGLAVASIIDASGRVAGFCSWDKRTGSVARLAVSPLKRERGAGSALLYAMAFESRGDTVYMPNINEKNEAAAEFLKARGFTEVRRKRELALRIE